MLRYHEDRNVNGVVKRVRAQQAIARASEYRTEHEVRRACAAKIAELLGNVNRQDGRTAFAAMSFGQFVEQRYFKHCDFRVGQPSSNSLHMEQSTLDGYRDIFRVHVKESPLAALDVRKTTPKDGIDFMRALPQQLSHQTHLRILNFVRGVFTYAVQENVREYNPLAECEAYGRRKDAAIDRRALSVREQKIRESNSHAYTLDEVAEMLDKLPDPARTVVAVAAFTGLTRSELKGLKWTDIDGDVLKVQRKVLDGRVGSLKTDAREAAVYILPVLRKILAKYRAAFPAVGDGWVFRGEKMLNPLDLDNLSRRDIPQFVKWYGWHAFRRGLATRLNDMGIGAKTIQQILRHANVSTTTAHYIRPDAEHSAAAMKKFDAAVKKLIK